ncbi:AMP-binding protein [Kocuria nitroreducens]|uniref:AMP-binding protein n=1 Tax=Kocuria nitroreducens TaxID=3058914 RepID=UPI0036DA02B8
MTTPPDLARVAFAADLARHGERPAVLTGERVLSYRELAERVGDVAARLGTERRLAVLAASNDVDSLVAYLAALTAGHPVLLVPADKPAAVESLVAAYDPDVLLRSGGDGTPVLDERRPGTRHELHPDLALLLSTSGSTGSPKLVRLSHENLASNAEAIAEYLGIGPDDRAATTLPMSYCYGLSVLNSHLLRGAGLVLTDLSVVDPCFWDLIRAHRATSFAAVPYTFDLLERVGFEEMELPHLRYVTQAGGRLAPEKVRRWTGVGQRAGWDLFVMYGATEATSRMAYLPPERAAGRAGTIGVPIPGGAFRIDPVDGLPDGELVYSGPNVMLGYAEHPGDLALGRTVEDLRTGDLARRHADGLYEVVGRRSRFVKIVGLRVDLGQVERILAELGVTAASAGSDERLVVAVEGEQDTSLLAKLVAESIGLPRPAVEMHAVGQLPRLGTGKVDYPAVAALGAARPAAAPPEPRAEGPEDVRRILAEVLDRPDGGDDDTFVSLEGDSLSYVAASVRLEQALGHLPPDWHLTPVRDLVAGAARGPRRRLVSFLETGIVLRAVAIVCIVTTHVELFTFQTAHVLFAVAGYNFARFQLHGERRPRLRRQLRSLGRIVVPSVAFIAVAHLLTDDYTVANVLLLNGIVGPQHLTSQWHFWFVEMLVYVLVAVTALMALPWADRAERAAPWLFPLALLAVGLVSRYDIVDPGLPKPAPVFWIFVLGWAAARSRTVLQRSLVTVLVLLTVPGYFDSTLREATLVAGILLLLWVPTLPVPVGLRRVAARLAGASLYVYLTHWLVYPPLVPVSPVLAVVASLAAGVAYWVLAERVLGGLRRAPARTVVPAEEAPLTAAPGPR